MQVKRSVRCAGKCVQYPWQGPSVNVCGHDAFILKELSGSGELCVPPGPVCAQTQVVFQLVEKSC